MVSEKVWEQVDRSMRECWHYNDEGKAYTEETYVPFMKQYSMIRKTFHKGKGDYHQMAESYKKTGRTDGGGTKAAADRQDDDALEALSLLKELERKLVAVCDPSSIKTYLWEAGNVPDMLKNDQLEIECDDAIQNKSLDPEGYVPGFVPYLLEDGSKHPAIIVVAGGHRSNFSCGDQVCRFFNQKGYHAALLLHRVGIQKLNYSLDLQRAVRYLRHHSEEMGIVKEKIGAIGLSFGGIVITGYIEKMRYQDRPSKYDGNYREDEVDRESGELNAFLGIYTSSSPFFPRREDLDYSQYPPVFMVLPGADEMVEFQVSYVNDLVRHGVRTEAHLFDGGVHGFGLGDSSVRINGIDGHIPAIAMWPELAALWLGRIFKE